MKFFKASDFEYNSSWNIDIVPWRDSKIVFVDNIYRYPDRVYEYLTSIHCIRSHKIGDTLNGIDFIDGQLNLDNRWDMKRKFLISKLYEIYDKPYQDDVRNTFNQFRLIKDFPGSDNNWWPHTDGEINFITFLNKTHNLKAGTSLYKAKSTKANTFLGKIDFEHTKPWKTSKQFEEELCILDRFNCGVAFPGQWFHGQTIVDNFFKDTTRFTEVTFL